VRSQAEEQKALLDGEITVSCNTAVDEADDKFTDMLSFSLGGTFVGYSPENVVASCGPCDMTKSTMSIRTCLQLGGLSSWRHFC
jgi:hypothetical protein